MGGGGGVAHYHGCQRKKPCRGVWGYPHPESFANFEAGNRTPIFATCHEICLRKIDLELENGKQLQVTIIKITESKENKCINRLDLSGLAGPGGQLTPLPPPPPPHTSYGSALKRKKQLSLEGNNIISLA